MFYFLFLFSLLTFNFTQAKLNESEAAFKRVWQAEKSTEFSRNENEFLSTHQDYIKNRMQRAQTIQKFLILCSVTAFSASSFYAFFTGWHWYQGKLPYNDWVLFGTAFAPLIFGYGTYRFNKAHRLISQKKDNFERRLLNNLNNKTKKFWSNSEAEEGTHAPLDKKEE